MLISLDLAHNYLRNKGSKSGQTFLPSKDLKSNRKILGHEIRY